ncbi:hypothetical protein [Thalassobacillus sp. C254]|uniref:hypothetical protein n=1 Tax=Thalassobacillus sp. C254 TaxID=1225341 RepID=UPI0009FB6E58|nr:hypothetical protein [Thalassobacillus sp. C254]
MQKTKSVSFNLNDPYEERLLKHAKQFPVFSAYVKRLIQRDMEENKTDIATKKPVYRSSGGELK